MTDALKRLLREADADGKTRRQLVAEALVQAALEGNVAAAKEIFDRLDGKVEQGQEITGKDGGPLELGWAQLAKEAEE